MKAKREKLWKPRVLVLFNTGTRIIPSRKDKSMTRRALKRALTKEFPG